MSGAKQTPLGSISLDQLLALNDEIAAIVRAGIPLEQGLSSLGREAPGRLGLLASRLADRMSAGEGLVEILEKDQTTFPPLWRAVALAGIRSGHLAAALQSLSRTGRRAKELRRSMALALIYPTIIVLLAYLAFVFSVTQLMPSYLRTHEGLLHTPADPGWGAIAGLSETVHIWGFTVPLLAAFLFAWWWYRSGRAMRSFSQSGSRRRFLFGHSRRTPFPSVRRALFQGRMATFAELLGLLDEHDVPLSESVVLAAEASGDRALSRAARTIAERMKRGETVVRRENLPQAFPPLLSWSLLSGMGRRDLRRALATSAEMYRQRALDAIRWSAAFMPMMLTVFIGGGAVLTEVMLVFLPFIGLLYRLAAP